MPFRVFFHEDVAHFPTYASAASYIQDKVSVMRLQGVSSSRWWGQIDRLSDGCCRLVWFDDRGVYHCTPWISD